MKEETQDQLVELTREAFRSLPEKHRAAIFRKAGHASPHTTSVLIDLAHIPPSFQPNRIDRWLRPEHQHALEKVVLAADCQGAFENLLRGFFCKAHPCLNDHLLTLIDPDGPSPAKLEDALNAVRAKFPQDPHLDLYVVATRWTCQEAMKAHQKLTDHCTEADAEASSTATTGTPSLTVDAPSSPPPNAAPSTPDDLAEISKALQPLTDTLNKLHSLQPADVAAATKSLMRAHTLTAGFVETVKSLAAELNEPLPQWSSREEFIAVRNRLAGLAAGRTEMHQRAALLLEDVSNLLTGVTVRHRLPSQSLARTDLARRAAKEITDHIPDIKPVILGHAGPALDWLKWLWQQDGQAAEDSQQKLRPHAPALAELLARADWRDLLWPSPLPASEAAPTPAKELVSVPAVTTQQDQTKPVPEPAPAAASRETPKTVPEADAALPISTSPVTQPSPPQPAPKDQPKAEPASPQPAKPVATPQEPPLSKATAPEPVPAPEPIEEEQTRSEPPDDNDPVAVTWRLARAGRWGLASHLSSLGNSSLLPPAWIFQAAALAPSISYEVSPISERLTEIFAQSADFRPESLEPESRPPTRLLLAAVALRPALLAPKTNAASILKLSGLKELSKLQALDQFVEAVAEFGLHRQALHPEMLRSSHNRVDWQRQLARVRAEVHEWLQQAPTRGFNYALAARIWRSWTAPSGPLRRLLEETAAASPQQAPHIKTKWDPWNRRAADLVQNAMKEINHTKTLDGTARDTLIVRIHEAVQLAERILVLLAQAPQPETTFRTEQSHELLAALNHSLRPAMQELQELLSQPPSDAVAAAASFCLANLKQAEFLLQGHLPLPGGEDPNPQWLLDIEILRDPVFPLALDGTVLPLSSSHLDRLLAIAETSPNWTNAWARQVEAENHAATAALLDFFRSAPPAGLDIASLESQRQRDLEACRRKVEKESGETRRLLDEFTSLGLCREKDYLTWSAEVTAVEQQIPAATGFAQLHVRLHKIRQSVQEQRESESARVRQRLAVAENIQPDDRARIAALLDAGDIHTATDYLDRVADGLPLPQATSPVSVFHAFFADDGWLPKAEHSLREASFNDCWQAAGTGGLWNGLDFQLLGPDQRSATAAHLQLWQNLERKRRAVENEVIQLASALGLQPSKATSNLVHPGAHTFQTFSLQAQVINERSAAVVPAFGSDASGRYTIHLVWGEPDADELLHLCRRETGDISAHIIVAFRVLSTKDRRELAEEARKPERVFKGIVVDRALFAFAAAQPTARLSTILHCALPFSSVEPYTIAAGEVPPEMFFGRGRELETLAQPRGSCFVYGGRQLGKTALLRALEHRFHHLQKGRAAIFVDLKRELFSRGRPMDDLWSVLVTRLKDVGVLSEKVGPSAGQEALFRHIKEWITASPDHRLILLLDEADSFLEQDGKESEHYEPFPRCQRLKGLMDDTGRRFKVIFAGLHNVQRTTRSSNHPLAHFGDAICIGPMLEEAESREARALVEQPMAAAGYAFASADVVSRILALTNYYPSLIQLFCHHLLRDLRANHVTRFPNARHTPPCVITSNHVQSVYGTSVRQRIHEKVRLTLDLDKRYEVIAYLLAFYNSIQAGQHGVDLREIRADASAYWLAGFAEMRTDDEFRGILEEMVGLGILRQVSGTSKFALRNENVSTLLGTQEEIMRHLESAKNWEPALKYEADKFRRLLTEKPKLTFSPLTAQQESELKAADNRVAILYGLPASGIGEVPAAMESESLFGKARTVTLTDCQDAQALSDRIARLDRPPRSHTLLLVPSETPWDETWVASACQRIGQFTSKDAFITVLFVSGPQRTWATLEGIDGAADLGVRQITLRPWHSAAVRQWLQDLSLDSEQATRDEIYNVTGNWPALLMRLSTSSNDALRRSCEDLRRLLQDPVQLAELRTVFGLSSDGADEPLRIAAELKQFSVDDVRELAPATEAAARERVTASINRADRLGLISVAGKGLEFDPVAANILLKSTTTA